MSESETQYVRDDVGSIVGYVKASGGHFEAWKRERLPPETPGNKHALVGVFDTYEGTVVALRAYG